ncbi:MAG: flagellar export protein FliJ [candidate division Zixibacteria bacterium]|nr:flagellar export protein FliJ [candidate division Zixibacteria bacterium]
MKKFRYRLEPVLKVKAHVEKQRQKEHAVALQQVYLQKEKLASISSEREQTCEQQRQRLTGPLRPHQLLAASRYLVKLKRDTITGSELLRGLEREAEVRRMRLVEATKQKKIHEKLKDRLQHRFISEFEEKEKKELDEIAVSGYSFRKRV